MVLSPAASSDTSQRFLPGHRIGLQIASSGHPKFAVNLGTAGDQSTQTEGLIAHNTLHHDAKQPSRLILTVLPAS